MEYIFTDRNMDVCTFHEVCVTKEMEQDISYTADQV